MEQQQHQRTTSLDSLERVLVSGDGQKDKVEE